jgi:hypothetical protein
MDKKLKKNDIEDVASGEAFSSQKRTFSTENMKFLFILLYILYFILLYLYFFFILFLGHFCLPGSGCETLSETERTIL